MDLILAREAISTIPASLFMELVLANSNNAVDTVAGTYPVS